MARVTDAEVQEIISLNVLTTTDPFITTANLLVTQHLGSSGLSAAILAQIEKYLAAHLVALHPDERQLTEQKLGEATDKYAGQFGDQLDFTQFGQTVKILDSTGILAGIGGDTVEIDTITVDNE
jgi:hypothetical protein